MGQSTTVIPTGGGGAKVQDSIPTNPQKGDLWVDTSETPALTKWYDGIDFRRVVPAFTSENNISGLTEGNSTGVTESVNANSTIEKSLQVSTSTDNVRFEVSQSSYYDVVYIEMKSVTNNETGEVNSLTGVVDSETKSFDLYNAFDNATSDFTVTVDLVNPRNGSSGVGFSVTPIYVRDAVTPHTHSL